jgi:hypothetical protein
MAHPGQEPGSGRGASPARQKSAAHLRDAGERS